MAIPSTDCFVRLAAACHPNLPATVRAVALDAVDDQMPSVDNALADARSARSVLNAVLASGSRALVQKMAPAVAKAAHRGQGLLFCSNPPTWDGPASLDVGHLLVCAGDDTALGVFLNLSQHYDTYKSHKDFQSLLGSLLMVDDGSWRPHDLEVQKQVAERFLRDHSEWTRPSARKLYRERMRTSVKADVWAKALAAHNVLSHSLGSSIVATWLVWGTTQSPGIFQQAFGLSAHAALRSAPLFPDWNEAQSTPQHRLEHIFSPFVEQIRGLRTPKGIV